MIKRITSSHNSVVKQLIQQRETLPSLIKHKLDNGTNTSYPVIIHGRKMVDECVVQHKLHPNTILLSDESLIDTYSSYHPSSLVITTNAIIKQVCNVQSTNGVCATFMYPHNKSLLYSDAYDEQSAFNKFKSCRRVVVINRLSDPGNLGTILRTAYSFGYDAVVVFENTISPFNDKVVKGSRTVLFQIPLIFCSKEKFIQWVQLINEVKCIVSTCETRIDGNQVHLLDNKTNISDLQKSAKLCIMVNSEHEGNEIEFALPGVDQFQFVHISMKNSYDSLNVSQVAAILLHTFR